MSNPLTRYASDSTNPVAGVIGGLLAPILPEYTPQRTTMAVDGMSGNGDASSQFLSQSVMPAVAANGGAGVVPYQQFIANQFARQVPGGEVTNIAMIDTSHVTDDGTSLKDMQIENPIWCTPYDDRSELQFDIYMPLFKLRGDYVVTGTGRSGESIRAQKQPGFHTLATLPLLNQIQAHLNQTRRDAAMLANAGGGALQRARSAVLDAGNDDPVVKRRRAAAAIPLQRNLYGSAPRSVVARQLAALQSLGAVDPQELFEKIEWLGPISKVTPAGAADSTSLDRSFNYSYHSRGKIHNVFSRHPQAGDSLFFSVGVYQRDQLEALAASTQNHNLSLAAAQTKRKYGDTAYVAGAAYVGAVQKMSNNDAFAQVRGWSSRDAAQFLAPVPPSEYLPWKAYELFCVEQEHRMAQEYVEYRYDAETGTMQPVNTLATEGLQEALASLPDLVWNNWITSTRVFSVGTVKTPMNQPTSMQAILNGHYDHSALQALPHIDIFQNYA